MLCPDGKAAIETNGNLVDRTSLGANPSIDPLLADPAYTTSTPSGDFVSAMDLSCTHLLISNLQGGADAFGRLDGSTFTPLPEPASDQGTLAAAAW